MRRSGGKLLNLLLTGVAVVVPALLAVHLVQAISLPPRMSSQSLAGSSIPATDSAELSTSITPGLMKVTNAQGVLPKSMVTGVLYTKGKALINWNGTQIPLQNGRYTYLGGEIIQMAPDAIGLLKLADGSSVHVCPGAKVRLSRNTDSQYSLGVMQGTSRFSFRADKDFEVRVNDVVMTSGLPAQTAVAGDFVTAEVQAKPESGCIICGLKRNLKITTPAPGGVRQDFTSSAGQVLDIGTIKDTKTTVLEKTPIPSQIISGLTPVAGNTGPANAYLCRCQEVQRYAKELARVQELAAGTEAPVSAPDLAPPVAPPQAPPLALAEPSAPDPFDPNVLPPPAAGEAEEPVLVVAPPVVPVAGSGGGLPASPS